ncbi:hypothetical protein DICSQDRAFT_153567 [Dichomitus squalens LYAD-421 SS1]|uniref:uncharacterized protein n=1 Tax=Dichomitus squalens (strain LYAD-421) TaxID=732165 RepID=UPI0004411182|nr:uncharacterized protein DICSQDRAFT_153567 [Dichomitus squalens LYAD-421 SS1]EJF63721.1 hypothetical protein DICSQDRAFT_153567 [Dichomitus squalens LYAD-421 SS1]
MVTPRKPVITGWIRNRSSNLPEHISSSPYLSLFFSGLPTFSPVRRGRPLGRPELQAHTQTPRHIGVPPIGPLALWTERRDFT